jgi:hypothetical protein
VTKLALALGQRHPLHSQFVRCRCIGTGKCL